MLGRIPIAFQMMLAVTVTSLLMAGAMVWFVLRGPPPFDAPLRLVAVARALEGEAIPADRSRRVPRTAVVDRTPVRPDGFETNAALARQLAEASGSSASSVVVYSREPSPARGGDIFGTFIAARDLGDGNWRVVDNSVNETLSRWRRRLLLTILSVLAIALAFGFLLSRRIATPIVRLGRAADEAKAGEDWVFDDHNAPPEIRVSADALRGFHQRSTAAAAQKLTMLGAMAHDIGTPLARLAFRMDRLSEEDRIAAQKDIQVIQRLLADSLTMARPWQGATHAVDLALLVAETVAQEQAAGKEVFLLKNQSAVISGHDLSLRRLIQNLIDNALHYGGDARLSVENRVKDVLLSVSDSGPGFPDEDIDRLLEPYVRGEQSRNPATGGSGLGLAIVRQIAERHRGTVSLKNGAGGGAWVSVILPLRNHQ
ncbi:MAG: HAMP domain-containing sensor histidine kinase [Pseudomonadota bacterium]|nr:HAMP domain-containing sensor histidine kinase [Pseudomonadota bacterium]